MAVGKLASMESYLYYAVVVCCDINYNSKSIFNRQYGQSHKQFTVVTYDCNIIIQHGGLSTTWKHEQDNHCNLLCYDINYNSKSIFDRQYGQSHKQFTVVTYDCNIIIQHGGLSTTWKHEQDDHCNLLCYDLNYNSKSILIGNMANIINNLQLYLMTVAELGSGEA
jgi:hypothetical protein